MSEPVVVEVSVAVPAARVWQAFRDPLELHRWHGWDYDGIDDEIRQIYFDGATISDEARTLDTHGAGRFALESRGTTTLVRVLRATPDGADSWGDTYDEINEGWRSFVEQLRFALERHPGIDRRTRVLERAIDPPTGEPWFEAPHQQGVVVDEHALVIVTRGRTIISAYGVDDGTIDAITARLA